MPSFYVEVESRIYFEYEIDAETLEDAENDAIERANHDVHDEWLDWEVIHSEEVTEDEEL